MTARDELEAAQHRLRLVEQGAVRDEDLRRLAEQLEREVTVWAETLERGERRALEAQRTTVGASVAAFGFAVVFMGPIVAIVGAALGRSLKAHSELSVACLVAGALIIGAASVSRARRAFAHQLSGEWKLLRLARARAQGLRRLAGSSR